MDMNQTPGANRVHIGLFGRRNAGKSSLINALTGQDLAIVSEVAGTTTDPVSKAMELLPLGPVVFVDTAGLDDDSTLGRERVKKSLQALEKVDIALLVVDGRGEPDAVEDGLVAGFRERNIPYLTVRNKLDLCPIPSGSSGTEMWVSAATGENIPQLRERIAQIAPRTEPPAPIVSDLLRPGDLVVLVVPIDSAAPKGRLILPQQQTIRDILEADAQVVVTKEDALPHTLSSLAAKPRLVITDSQVFERVAADTPNDVPLTSFSILFARHKGVLKQAAEGIKAVEALEDGDAVLISEGCTHHRQCDDIGTVKLPRWLAQYTGKELRFAFSSGNGFPEDLTPYRLVVHCGGCMLPQRSMGFRLRSAREQRVPITNYGILIAQMKGILSRSLEPFAEEAKPFQHSLH